MESCPDNIIIQELTIEALVQLGNNDDNKFKILKCGCDKCIVESMIKHNHSLQIMNAGCKAIINLAVDNYSLKTLLIVQQDGADQIINSMIVHSQSPRFVRNCVGASCAICIGQRTIRFKE